MSIDRRGTPGSEAQGAAIGADGADGAGGGDGGGIAAVVGFSLRRRGLVLALAAAACLAGVFSWVRLPIDAVPDITGVQVQVNAEAAGYTPVETEQAVTVPLEAALGGLPRLDRMRSLSRYGLTQVTLMFSEGTDIHLARQWVSERLQEARESLPEGVSLGMGPIATGLGEIFMYVVEADPAADSGGTSGRALDAFALREIQDYIIRPQLRPVEGVAEVNAIGGYAKQYQVAPDPGKLMAYGLDWHDVVEALERDNLNAGGGYVERHGEQALVRVPGRMADWQQLRDVVVGIREGVPVRLSQVASVGIGRELRTGAATENGSEVVLGTVMMLMGENSRAVARRVAEKVESIQASLPPGVRVRPLYDRTALVDRTLETVEENLLVGAGLVLFVLFALLGDWRAALITALVIPLSMLLTAIGMVKAGVSGNLMSLGALDFGLIVDGAVIIVENCLRRLSEARRRAAAAGVARGALTLAQRLENVRLATLEVARPSLFGSAIILAVYAPILALQGVEGKMFHPMALTVMFALASAMLLSVTVVPVLTALLCRGAAPAAAEKAAPVAGGPATVSAHDGATAEDEEEETKLMKGLRRAYAPVLASALRHRGWVAAAAASLVFLCALLFTRLGREFMPRLDEGDIALHAMRIPGTGLEQSVAMQHPLEERFRAFPEVADVFAKIGTAEVANDPMPPYVADVFLVLKPRSEWPDPRRGKADLVEALEAAAREVPGNAYEFTQPIEMRFNELIAGVRSDVAVKVFGEDMETLAATAEEVAAVIREIPGAADVKVEAVTGLPFLSVTPRRQMLARYGLGMAEVQSLVAGAVGGREAGEILEGDRRFPVVVRLSDSLRSDPEALRRLPVRLPAREGEPAEYAPLSAVADFDESVGPAQVSRENGRRRVVVGANVRGRDLGSFVEEARARVAAEVKHPPGAWLEWGGQYENLQSATDRLRWVVPLALAVIFGLLYGSLGSWGLAWLVFSGIPLALTGGVAALALRGLPFSISAAVGFIALSGIAVLNGLVLVGRIESLRERGVSLAVALREGPLSRLRPVLMTALVASLGFLPMALNTGTGAEVQRPLATVVIGGILSSTALTLLVLPALYGIFRGSRREGADGSPA